MMAKLSKFVVIVAAAGARRRCKGKKHDDDSEEHRSATRGPEGRSDAVRDHGQERRHLRPQQGQQARRLAALQDRGRGRHQDRVHDLQAGRLRSRRPQGLGRRLQPQGQPALREGRLRLRRQVRHVGGVRHRRPAKVAEVERDTDFDGKFDVKEIYDTPGVLQSVRRDRNGDSQPDQWEQYKDTVLIAILYDDDFDGKVDRREEIPGATPKVEMPTTLDPTATGTISPRQDAGRSRAEATGARRSEMTSSTSPGATS